MSPFYEWGSTASRLEPLQGGRRIQWTFIIANRISNKFFATSNNFHSPVILGHNNSYNIPWYIEHRFLQISHYINQKNVKNRSFYQIWQSFSWSYVSYCPFAWMWHGRILHHRIFRLHLQEETFIISMFARWRQICFYSQWQFGNSS